MVRPFRVILVVRPKARRKNALKKFYLKVWGRVPVGYSSRPSIRVPPIYPSKSHEDGSGEAIQWLAGRVTLIK